MAGLPTDMARTRRAWILDRGGCSMEWRAKGRSSPFFFATTAVYAMRCTFLFCCTDNWDGLCGAMGWHGNGWQWIGWIPAADEAQTKTNLATHGPLRTSHSGGGKRGLYHPHTLAGGRGRRARPLRPATRLRSIAMSSAARLCAAPRRCKCNCGCSCVQVQLEIGGWAECGSLEAELGQFVSWLAVL